MNARFLIRSLLGASLSLAGLAVAGCDKGNENNSNSPTNNTGTSVGGVGNTPNAPSSGGVGTGMAGAGTGMTSTTTAPSNTSSATAPAGTSTVNPNNGMRGELSTDRARDAMPELPKGSNGQTTTSPIR